MKVIVDQWSEDKFRFEKIAEYDEKEVRVRSLGADTVRHPGKKFHLIVPDGKWDDGSDKHIIFEMEGGEVDLLASGQYLVMGYAQDGNWLDSARNGVYHKQRWHVIL